MKSTQTIEQRVTDLEQRHFNEDLAVAIRKEVNQEIDSRIKAAHKQGDNGLGVILAGMTLLCGLVFVFTMKW